MTTKTKTRITIQTRQTTVVRGLRVRCHQCGAEVSIISPADAAGALQTTPREIHGLLESGDLHTVEEPSGEKLICANSLTAASSENEIEIDRPTER
jgi:hypothetical protein